jgi:hypothetical protein
MIEMCSGCALSALRDILELKHIIQSQMQGNITLDRQAYQAMQFLKLQGETKDWVEAVTGKQLASDGKARICGCDSFRIIGGWRA